MPASPQQAEYISDLFEQCRCDEHEVAEMLERVAGIPGGQWPKDAETISWGLASELIAELIDLKKDRGRHVGRREYGR